MGGGVRVGVEESRICRASNQPFQDTHLNNLFKMHHQQDVSENEGCIQLELGGTGFSVLSSSTLEELY